jgi:outer membrane murein-binding lipoprotein Lpp
MGLGRTQIAADVEDLKAQVKQLAKRPAAGMQ